MKNTKYENIPITALSKDFLWRKHSDIQSSIFKLIPYRTVQPDPHSTYAQLPDTLNHLNIPNTNFYNI